MRQIEIHHMRDTLDVEPTSGEVGSNERIDPPRSKSSQGSSAGRLAFVPMNGSHLPA
jgi:hypothetical protein